MITDNSARIVLSRSNPLNAYISLYSLLCYEIDQLIGQENQHYAPCQLDLPRFPALRAL